MNKEDNKMKKYITNWIFFMKRRRNTKYNYRLNRTILVTPLRFCYGNGKIESRCFDYGYTGIRYFDSTDLI